MRGVYNWLSFNKWGMKFNISKFYSLKLIGVTLPGDILLLTAFISYVGCFTKRYRQDLMEKYWIPFIKSVQVRHSIVFKPFYTMNLNINRMCFINFPLQPPIPITADIDPLSLLTDDAQIAKWNNEGLPSDRMSIENATVRQ